MLEGRKQSLLLACRDLDVRMAEKRENIGDGEMSSESDETLSKNLQEFDAKLAAVVSCFLDEWTCFFIPPSFCCYFKCL